MDLSGFRAASPGPLSATSQSKSNCDQTIHLVQQSLQTQEQVSAPVHSLSHYLCFTARSVAHLFSSVNRSEMGPGVQIREPQPLVKSATITAPTRKLDHWLPLERLMHHLASGITQIGDVHARSCIVFFRSSRGATPARTASQVDHRQVGFSRTLT